MDQEPKTGVNSTCALCARACKQTDLVVLQSCAKFSKELTLDEELKAFNRAQARQASKARSRKKRG